jgi:hypothetical protein
MRFFALVIVGLAMGCGSVLNGPDGGGGGSGGGGCVVGQSVFAPGTSFRAADGCNTCTCTASRQVACTEIGCQPDAGACAFDATYRYGETGGLVAYESTATLSPPASYLYLRTSRITDPADLSCAPALPACGAVDLIGADDIMLGISDPAVQQALSASTPPIFGRDPRAYDGTIFQLLRADGHGFLAGETCGVATGPGACPEVPPGIARLVAALRALDQQQLADASCAALR